ncbi:aspartate aminotransferase family protein [Streptomonospora sediminis]
MNDPNGLWPYLMAPADQGDDGVCAVWARGHRIGFADGSEVLCGASGLWNANLGFGNPAIADAVGAALRDASYLSAFRYENAYARRAAADLLEVCGPGHYGKVLFSTSGGAANDAAMKLARQYHALAGEPRRNLVAALRGGFHGLTFGGFSLTGEDLGQQSYGVDQRLIRHTAPNDTGELAALVARSGSRLAAVVVEPVLGTGTLPLTGEYVAELLRLRAEHGFLVIADEVATGFGRTGSFFASQRWPEPPDLLITSKGLTNGTCAAAAIVASHRVAGTFADRNAVLSHAETQGGSPVPCAAISATIAEMRRLDAVAAGRRVGERLREGCERLVRDVAQVAGTAGSGCFRSLAVAGDSGDPLPPEQVPDLVAAVRAAGAVVHPGPHGVQLIPALTYSDAEVDELLECVRRGIAAHSASRRPGAAAVAR